MFPSSEKATSPKLPSSLTECELDHMINDLCRFYAFSFFDERGIDTAIGMTFAFEQMAISYGLVGNWLYDNAPEYDSTEMVHDLCEQLDKRAHATNHTLWLKTVRPHMPFMPEKAPTNPHLIATPTEDKRYTKTVLPQDLTVATLDKMIADIVAFYDFTFFGEREVGVDDGLGYSIEQLAVIYGLAGDWLYDSDENYNVADMMADFAARLDARAEEENNRAWIFNVRPNMPYLS